MIAMPFYEKLLTQQFARNFIAIYAPLASYACIPFVTKWKLKSSAADPEQRELLVAQEVPRQGINAVITIATALLGSRLGGKAYDKKVIRTETKEAARTIGTALMSFVGYTFVRPYVGWEMFDQWLRKKDTVKGRLNVTSLPGHSAPPRQPSVTQSQTPYKPLYKASYTSQTPLTQINRPLTPPSMFQNFGHL